MTRFITPRTVVFKPNSARFRMMSLYTLRRTQSGQQIGLVRFKRHDHHIDEVQRLDYTVLLQVAREVHQDDVEVLLEEVQLVDELG